MRSINILLLCIKYQIQWLKDNLTMLCLWKRADNWYLNVLHAGTLFLLLFIEKIYYFNFHLWKKHNVGRDFYAWYGEYSQIRFNKCIYCSQFFSQLLYLFSTKTWSHCSCHKWVLLSLKTGTIYYMIEGTGEM